MYPEDEDFEHMFIEKLFSGFEMCKIYDFALENTLDNQGIEFNDIKLEKEQDICKKLLELCDIEGITNVSKNYLLFMISIIKCAKYYINLKESDKKIDYKDPEEYLIHRKFDEQKKKLEEKIENHKLSMTDEEKYVINNLVKIDTFELQTSKGEPIKIRRSTENQVSLLQKAYKYLYPDFKKPDMGWIKTELESWKKLKKDDDDENNNYENKNPNEVIKRIIKSVKDARLEWSKKNEGKKYQSTEIQDLCMMALEVANNDIQQKSCLEKCSIPIWNMKDGSPDITKQDLKQGNLGDCWLVAALIPIVKDSSENILRCFPNRETEIDENGNIKEDSNDNGCVTVRLYRVMLHAHKKNEGRIRAYARPICPIDIKMSNTIFSKGNKSNVAWPRFIEKAVSIYRQEKLAKVDISLKNYGDRILNGSHMWNSEREKEKYGHKAAISGNSADGIIQAMILGTTTGGTNDNYIINGKTNRTSLRKYLGQNLNKFKNKIVQVGFKKDFKVNGKLVITKHTYSIDEVNTDSGYVTITNPWNDSDSDEDERWRNNVKVPIDKFCKYCRRISFSTPKKENKK